MGFCDLLYELRWIESVRTAIIEEILERRERLEEKLVTSKLL